MSIKIPRDKENNYSEKIISERKKFIASQTKKDTFHINKYSFNPEVTVGNIENFIGVSQVPMGLAGPLLVNGEYANGEFFVPLATTEGTLVASYNRGMKVAAECGGVKTTILDDKMNRAPCFVFDDARLAKKFVSWVRENYETIKELAESTSSVAQLKDIEIHPAAKMVWLRFNYFTGDAAGQNMVTKATRKACIWIKEQIEGLHYFTLAASFDTDKKHSHVNYMNTRGKKIVAEITIPNEIMKKRFRIDTKTVYYQRMLSAHGSLISGSTNNGIHSANGITAMFIACGQDVANVAESSAGLAYSEIKDNGDYYYSITIPALIVATYGGGTALPTQRECLEMMDCYGKDKVNKFAEIVAATVLCGDISLSGAVLSDEWVSSHEEYGRNR